MAGSTGLYSRKRKPNARQEVTRPREVSIDACSIACQTMLRYCPRRANFCSNKKKGRTVFRNETLALLRLEEERAARFGEEREVAALIALDRGPGGEALLAPAAPSTVLRKVLECGSSIRLKADALLTGLGELANSVPGYALRYSSSAEAAALVEKELCAG